MNSNFNYFFAKIFTGEEFGKHESIVDMFRKRDSAATIITPSILPPSMSNKLEKDNGAFANEKSI